jgi:hypothetical protein
MRTPTFTPKNDRERLAYEAGRSQGLREAFQILAQNRPLAPTSEGEPPNVTEAPAPEPSAEVLRLEDLLVSAGFVSFSDEDTPARQWKRGEEEVAIEEARVDEQVRWFTADKDEPDTMTIPEAIRRATDESRKR